MTSTKNNPLVSVIIPVYNAELYLEESIRSALEQTYRPFEILVVDDGSTDGSGSIARKFKEQIIYIYQSNQGVAAARNQGINKSSGKFLTFLDADDLWKPKKLSIQMKYMLDHPELQYTITRVKYFLEPGHNIPSGFRRDLLIEDCVGMLLGTLMAKKNLFEKTGHFDPKLKISEDVDWFARVNDIHVSTAVIQEVLLLKRVHDSNISNTVNEDNTYLLRALKRSIQRKKITEDSS